MVTTVLSSPGQENERTKDLIVEQKFHRAIIGQKGEKIKEVRDKFPEVTRFNFFFLSLYDIRSVTSHSSVKSDLFWTLSFRS